MNKKQCFKNLWVYVEDRLPPDSDEWILCVTYENWFYSGKASIVRFQIEYFREMRENKSVMEIQKYLEDIRKNNPCSGIFCKKWMRVYI
jgi:hypothetical protein